MPVDAKGFGQTGITRRGQREAAGRHGPWCLPPLSSRALRNQAQS